jgi:hypothetical protein
MMKRSQIYLPAEQWRRLDALGHQTRRSVSHLIRQAIDSVYQGKPVDDFDRILEGISGLWRDRKDLPATQTYVRTLRRGNRLKRLGVTSRA